MFWFTCVVLAIGILLNVKKDLLLQIEYKIVLGGQATFQAQVNSEVIAIILPCLERERTKSKCRYRQEWGKFCSVFSLLSLPLWSIGLISQVS
jgi:hypothetical protein